MDTPEGELLIYGTVLPWANDKGDDGDAKMWRVHYETVQRQGEDWRALRQLHPGVPLVVAGDFNQDRDGSGWYGTRHGRDLLTSALAGAELICMTDEDVVSTGKLRATHLVDHIAICRRWATGSRSELTCWEQIDDDGTRLSDHPTVAIDLAQNAGAAESDRPSDDRRGP